MIFLLFFLLINSLTLLASKKQNDFSNWQVGSKSTPSGPQAENIKCKNENEEHFSALITIPTNFGTVPVFHDSPHINPIISDECAMKQLGANAKFNMMIANFKTCGVQIQKGNDGAQWMSITIRFPYVGGLRMAEDEYITIMCKPQDRTITKNHVFDLRSSVINPPKTIFSSTPLDFDCNLELFIKGEGDTTFSRQLPSDGVIEMGNEIQLRGTVRQGDGWRYAMFKDVTVHKIASSTSTLNVNIKKNSASSLLSQLNTDNSYGQKNVISEPHHHKKSSNHRYGRSTERDKRNIPEAAFLVFSDGCRNPAFRNVAPQHPYQDNANSLIVNFNFKAFMFQDMQDGDTIRITAKVVACVEQHECQPTHCLDDDQYGYGRKKRSTSRINIHPNVSDFSHDIQFKVVSPGFSSRLAIKAESEEFVEEYQEEKDFININSNIYINRKCRNVIYLIGSLSLLFSFAVTIASSIVVCKSKKSK